MRGSGGASVSKEDRRLNRRPYMEGWEKDRTPMFYSLSLIHLLKVAREG